MQSDGVAHECEACIAPPERSPAPPPRPHAARLAEEMKRADERFRELLTTEAANDLQEASRAVIQDLLYAWGR